MKQQPDPASAQSTCELRAPKPCDYDRMADLAGQLGYPSTGAQVGIRLDEMVDSNHYAVYVAELPGGRIAGWIGMYAFRSVEQDSCAGVSGLIVDQEVRSCEIGKARTTFIPARSAIAYPNDTAASPAEFVLWGCQARETNAPAAPPPMAEQEIKRDPSSCRASSALVIA